MKHKPQQKKQPNPYFFFIGLVFQMGITIYCFAKLGKFLDESQGYDKLFTPILTICGVLVSFYILFKQLKRINN